MGVAFDELCTDDVSTDELVTAGLDTINMLVGLAVELTAAELKLGEYIFELINLVELVAASTEEKNEFYYNRLQVSKKDWISYSPTHLTIYNEGEIIPIVVL